MITYVKGLLTEINDQSIVVEVQGLGYEIICGNPYEFQHEENGEVHVHTYQHVREDAIQLYGFKHPKQKTLFMKLISVSGIGPKSGIAIIGTVDVQGFVAAVEQEDEKYLTQFPGVGKKTARQIILDLKGTLEDIAYVESSDEIPIIGLHATTDEKKHLQDAIEALSALGYSDTEISAVTPTLQQDDQGETDELIRKALRLLAKH
ncbi:MAG TPA: Holliday junction branch migration protein RuvA [Bacillota bacterium]|nr:Holliday junction branch migration protein RuvA [Bacillota bacterium]